MQSASQQQFINFKKHCVYAVNTLTFRALYNQASGYSNFSEYVNRMTGMH